MRCVRFKSIIVLLIRKDINDAAVFVKPLDWDPILVLTTWSKFSLKERRGEVELDTLLDVFGSRANLSPDGWDKWGEVEGAVFWFPKPASSCEGTKLIEVTFTLSTSISPLRYPKFVRGSMKRNLLRMGPVRQERVVFQKFRVLLTQC